MLFMHSTLFLLASLQNVPRLVFSPPYPSHPLSLSLSHVTCSLVKTSAKGRVRSKAAMAAGRVKAAMGFQKSPATPKIEPTKRPSNPSPKSSPMNPKGNHPLSPKPASVFTRSFGVYFPRSSAQVQPRPPDVAELLRAVEALQERESRLRTELLEHKLFNEAATIVPFLERELSAKDDELRLARQRIEGLEAENRVLQLEIEGFHSRVELCQRKEKKIQELEEEVEELRKAGFRGSRRFCIGTGESDECSSSSSSQRFQGLVDASARSTLLKNLRKSPKSTDIAPNLEAQRQEAKDIQDPENLKPRGPRTPKPPPIPSSSPSSSSSASYRAPSFTGLPPIPPPVSLTEGRQAPPPPPPPPPARRPSPAAARVRRVPEVVEFYHSLMRRDSRRESGAGSPDSTTAIASAAVAASARDMIGEIENRSHHLLAIKADVETQGDFIRFLMKEVNNAAFSNIEDVVAFVKWLDDELSFLVDERAVLKHFDWPEHKADALREAAFGYRDLKKLESEASSFCDDGRQLCSVALKKMQGLLERLEHGVYSLARVREGATKRCKAFQIPWDWMQENGFVSQIKLASVRLAMKYMKRVSFELEAIGGGIEEEELMLQGVRFAFRVHQFAGGFDVETMRAFEELRDKARSFHI